MSLSLIISSISGRGACGTVIAGSRDVIASPLFPDLPTALPRSPSLCFSQTLKQPTRGNSFTSSAAVDTVALCLSLLFSDCCSCCFLYTVSCFCTGVSGTCTYLSGHYRQTDRQTVGCDNTKASYFDPGPLPMGP